MEKKYYGFTIYDRDGGIIAINEEEQYDSYAEADQAAKFYEDYPAYASHVVEEEEPIQ